MPESPEVEPGAPSGFGAVLRLPLSLYARHPIALLAATALPLLTGQALGAHYRLRETEGARVVDGEVLSATVLPSVRPVTFGTGVELGPGWPADAVTFAGWVLGLAAGSLVTTALLFNRRPHVRDVVRTVLHRLPLFLLWGPVLLVLALVVLVTLRMGWEMLRPAVLGLAPWSPGALLWPVFGLAALVALICLLLGLLVSVLHDLTLAEGISAAWMLSRGSRIAHLLCLVPLTVLLFLPQVVEERVLEALTGSGTPFWAALGTALGVRILLVLVLAPLPVLLLTGQALWIQKVHRLPLRRGERGPRTRRTPLIQTAPWIWPDPGPAALLPDSGWLSRLLDRLGVTTRPPSRRPAATASLIAVLLLVPLVGGGLLWANPHGTPVVTTERLDRSEIPQLVENALPAGDHPWKAFVDEESRMLTFLACADPECSRGESAELLHPYDLPDIPAPDNPWDSEPVRVLSMDGDRPVLLIGITRVTCVDPLCGLTA